MEKYVEKCVESVLIQDYDNIEIILVDDGSTDESLNIVKKKYSSITNCKIITKKNGGLASARNAGLEIAQGDFIYFIDADDYIEERAISLLVECMENCNADFCCHRTMAVDEAYNLIGITGTDYEYNFLEDKDKIIKETLLVKNIKAAVTLKMWKRNFILENQLRFLEGIIHEDILFSVKASFCANKVAFVNKPLYFVLNRRSSISRIMKARNITDYFILFDDMEAYMRELGYFQIYEKYFYACYFKCILFNLLISTVKIRKLSEYCEFFLLLRNSIYMDRSKGKNLHLLSSKSYWIYRLSLHPVIFRIFGLLCYRFGRLAY